MPVEAAAGETPAPFAAEHVPAEVIRDAPAARAVPVQEAAPVPVAAPGPVAAPALAAIAAAPAVAAIVAAPPVAAEPYELPTDNLNAIASGAGLQWVNSDSEKIRAVQASMASQPEAAHVPRQPKPVAAVDDGPLVLVETKKDLSQVRLPFDA